MDEWLRELAAQAYRHRRKLGGALLGLVSGWLVVTLGLFKALVIGFCLLVGYAIGAWLESEQDEDRWPRRP